MIRSLFVGLLALLSLSAVAEGVKVSERFGYDPADATANLQAALDSELPEIVVDRKDGPWVVRPLFAKSNQKIIFEKGVELTAKRGEFTGRNDCLVTCANVTNVTISGYGATWRMHRADYDAAPYSKGEWRHSLKITGCGRITVEGLTLLESGGDGVYVASSGEAKRSGPPSTDIVLRDLVCDRHYRQGMSIISARGLLIERCVMINTWGTPPAAGVDFEPNNSGEELVDCVMRDCRVANNQGSGFEFYLGNFNSSTPPVSVRIENCRSSDNSRGCWLALGNGHDLPKGCVSFSSCRFERERGPAAMFLRKPAGSVSAEFRDCVFKDCQFRATAPRAVTDVTVSSPARVFDPPTDGMSFDGCTIIQPMKRDWLQRSAWCRQDGLPTTISGKMKVVSPEGTESVVLGRRWAEGYFTQFAKPIRPSLPFDASRAKPTDLKPGQSVGLPPIKYRDHAVFRFFAATAGVVRFTGRTERLNMRRTPPKAQVTVTDPDGAVVARMPLQSGKSAPLVIRTSRPGFHLMVVDVPRQFFLLETSDVPVALVTEDDRPQNVLAPEGTVFFRTGAAEDPAVAVTGSDGQEWVRACVREPSGAIAWDGGEFAEWRVFFPKAKRSDGLWSLELGRPEKGAFEDCSFQLLGTVPEFFLSAEKYW